MNTPTTPYTVLYDGDCGFCNFWVKWILKNDTKEVFSFAALQSEFGQAFLSKNHKSTSDLDTIYLLIDNGTYYQKLDAVIRIGKILGGRFKAFKFFQIFPSSWRDKMYQLVANNRKKLMQSHCYLPSPEERKRFIQ